MHAYYIMWIDINLFTFSQFFAHYIQVTIFCLFQLFALCYALLQQHVHLVGKSKLNPYP